VGDSDILADELCAIFARNGHGIAPDQLTDADVKALLAKLEAVERIDGYFIHQFLANASKRAPEAVIQFLLNRIEKEQARWGISGSALPLGGFHFRLEGLVESEKYQDFLRTIRDRIVGATGLGPFWVPKVFKEISLNTLWSCGA
jgi:hypothetical protein